MLADTDSAKEVKWKSRERVFNKVEEQKEPKPIAQSNVCEWKTAPLSSNSYSRVVASIPPQFIFKPFQPIVELVYGQKQEIYNEQSGWDLQIKSSHIKRADTGLLSQRPNDNGNETAGFTRSRSQVVVF